MKLPSAIAPYSILIKLGLIVGLLASVYFYGRHDGKAAQLKKDTARIETLRTSLKGAASALSVASGQFREIDTQTGANIKAATDRAKAATTAAKEAKEGQAALAREVARINAAVDTSPCRDVPVGVKLN